MPLYYDAGVFNRNDASDLPEGALQSTQASEYRRGNRGLWVARGRKRLLSSVARSSFQFTQLDFLAFDDGGDWLLVRTGRTNFIPYLIEADGTLVEKPLLSVDDAPDGYVSFVHFSNRFYVNSDPMAVVEYDTSTDTLTIRRAGLVPPGQAPSLNTSGSGVMSAALGLTYWYTWVSSKYGWESDASLRRDSGVITGKSVAISRFETPIDLDIDKWRVYQTTDGGAFPDGGFIGEFSISQTSVTVNNKDVVSLVRPVFVYVGNNIPFSRDGLPPDFRWMAIYDGSILGGTRDDPRSIQFSYPNFPASYPGAGANEVFISTELNDQTVAGHQIGELFLPYSHDAIHKLNGLPSAGSIDASTYQKPLTKKRGTFGPNTITTFTFQGRETGAYVSRDGIWATDGLVADVELTGAIDWAAMVDVTTLDRSWLRNDIENDRLIFVGRKPDSTPRILYLYYNPNPSGVPIRVLTPDHGDLVALTEIIYKGRRRIVSLEEPGAGHVYLESEGVLDESDFFHVDGRMAFRARTREMIAAPGQQLSLSALHIFHSKPDFSNAPTSLDPQVWIFYDPEDVDLDDLPPVNVAGDRNYLKRGMDTIDLLNAVESVSHEVRSDSAVQFCLSWYALEADESSPAVGKGA